ncbi:MAG: preprotein translocase subunit SecA [Bacteroides sp.]|nr:preprotein translocase subunit SecA [Bacteroides sp.]MCM1378605.1 preprotein translocase subunit SecA [Bacteroides sp.]MCM1444906.1 preprotein translocase subunit SecA [Prevotella sp.]
MSVTTFLSKIFGNKSQRDLREIQPIVNKINKLRPELEALTADELRQKINDVRADIRSVVEPHDTAVKELRTKLEALPFDERQPLWDEIDKHEKETLDAIESKLNEHLPIVFATLRETAARFVKGDVEVTATQLDRDLAAQGRDFVSITDEGKAIYKNHWMAGGNEITWDMVHYDVQLIGGIVLHQGKIAEMATGEGKTLVATLPVFLRSLSGRGVHVVTVNDYLSKRDSEWMGPLYMFHGSTVDCIDKHQPNTPERRAAYNCDITFGTNNEFGFDYLRDNMAMSLDDMVQRKHYYAIVDEVDSVLIDDARTPLIISGPVPKGDDQYFNEYKSNVQAVVEAQRKLQIKLLSEAREKLASDDKEAQKEGALALYRAYLAGPKYQPLIKFLSQEGMKTLLLKTEGYFLQDNASEMPKAVEPLYYKVDEKQRSVDLTDKGYDVLTGNISDPTFFVLPDIATQLSALDSIEDLGKRTEEKDRLLQEYAIKAERVHTVNQLLKAYTLFNKDEEYVIDDNKIKIVDEQTGRIMEGRRYSDGLHQAIEAKEGVKVEAATQTFATITLQNYFRMYHKLAGMTGTAETEAGEFWDIYKLDVVTIPTNRPVAREDMNDRVYRTKKAKYAAVIKEIEDLVAQGRPVLVGTTSVDISENLSRQLSMRHIPHNVLNAKLHQREADIVAQAGRKGTVTIATNMAGRGTDIKLPDEVKEAGGLAIIGTERHESRRVDRQLRGRAGRQGDPGTSVFFVSFEDNLMRMFAGDNVMKALDKLGFSEDEMLESPMVNKSIEKAQKRVEENNFGIRKHLLEYDDVMNKQRTYIYARRQHALKGERIGIDISNMLYDVVENLVETHNPGQAGEFEDLNMELMKLMTIQAPFTEEEYRTLAKEDAVQKLYEAAMETLGRKSEKIVEVAQPVIKDLYENQGYKDIIQVPITDGKRLFRLIVNVEESYNAGCKNIVTEWHKLLMLASIDELWKEHLRELDELRQSVQNATYEQKDPLVIYKVESFHLFEEMLKNLNDKATTALMRGQIYVRQAPPTQQADAAAQAPRQPEVQRATAQKTDYSRYQANKAESYEGADAQRQAASAQQGQRQAPQPLKAAPKIGRNDPCPCGSGKKYKACHGKGL